MDKIITKKELKLLESIIEKSEYEDDLNKAKKSLEDYDKNGGVSWEQVKQESGL